MNLELTKKIPIIILLFLRCDGYPINRENLNLLYPEKNNSKYIPRIIYHYKTNVDDSNEESDIYILRDKNEELLTIIKGNTITYKERFIMQNYGPFEYVREKKEFIPSKLENPNIPFIITSVKYFKMGEDNFQSIFIDIISEEPPLGIFKVPMVIRKGVKIFDGLNTLEGEDFLKEWKISYTSFLNGNLLSIKSPIDEHRDYLWKDGSFHNINQFESLRK